MPGWCRTLIFICLLALWSAVVTLSFALILLFYQISRQKDRLELTARIMANIYGRGCMLIVSPWVKVKTENLRALHAPCIVAANHLSMLDLTCLSFLPEKNMCVLIKSWPADMPFMGLFVRKAGYINIDELSFAEVARRIDEEIKKQSMIVVFPEGSRSSDGKLKRLRSGAFRLAVKTGLPVYPLRYSGTNQAFPKGSFSIRPARVTMRLYGKIIPPQSNNELYDSRAHKQLGHQVKACLQEAA